MDFSKCTLDMQLYFEVKNSPFFDGDGFVTTTIEDVKNKNALDITVEYANILKDLQEDFEVTIDDIRVIDKTEYDELSDEDTEMVLEVGFNFDEDEFEDYD